MHRLHRVHRSFQRMRGKCQIRFRTRYMTVSGVWAETPMRPMQPMHRRTVPHFVVSISQDGHTYLRSKGMPTAAKEASTPPPPWLGKAGLVGGSPSSAAIRSSMPAARSGSGRKVSPNAQRTAWSPKRICFIALEMGTRQEAVKTFFFDNNMRASPDLLQCPYLPWTRQPPGLPGPPDLNHPCARRMGEKTLMP